MPEIEGIGSARIMLCESIGEPVAAALRIGKAESGWTRDRIEGGNPELDASRANITLSNCASLCKNKDKPACDASNTGTAEATLKSPHTNKMLSVRASDCRNIKLPTVT